MRHAAAPIGFVLVLYAGIVQAATFSVGSAGTCTHATLASAIAAAAANGPNLDEIRIGHALTLAGPLDVTEHSVAIYGAISCDSDTPAQRVIQITSGDGFRMFGGASSLRTLDLAGLTIIMTAGRTLSLQNRSYVILERETLLSGGTATNGGNVLMTGANTTLLIDTGARVYSGDATGDGGGIHCSAGGTIALTDGAVESNHADGDGGGLYLDDCTLTDSAGLFGSGPLSGGIYDNRAEGSGGGIYAASGAALNLAGSAPAPVVIHDNRAQTGAGGGIAVTGATTSVDAQNTRIYDNFATSAGGVDVRNGASFTMERVGTDCVEPLECSTISRNLLFARLEAGGHGGAISVTSGGSAAIFQTYITGNDADELGGIAYVNAASLRIEGSMLYANDAGSFGSLIDVAGGAQFVLAFSTTASNTGSGDVLADVSAGSSAAFHANVLGETEGGLVETAGGGSSPGSCNVALLVPAPPAWTGTIDANPNALFVDLAEGDLHLRPSAPIFDTCGTSGYAPLRPDFDDEPRGFDQVAIEDGLGTYDAGADEYLPEPAALGTSLTAIGALALRWRRRRPCARRS